MVKSAKKSMVKSAKKSLAKKCFLAHFSTEIKWEIVDAGGDFCPHRWGFFFFPVFIFRDSFGRCSSAVFFNSNPSLPMNFFFSHFKTVLILIGYSCRIIYLMLPSILKSSPGLQIVHI